jgi:hypothetical protein
MSAIQKRTFRPARLRCCVPLQRLRRAQGQVAEARVEAVPMPPTMKRTARIALRLPNSDASAIIVPAFIGSEGTMTYKVIVDDNFHFMDEQERTTHGEFETLSAAIEACRQIVDDCLASAYKAGMSAEDLYSKYESFGEDPWISGADGVPFSAWDYARQRCSEVCGAA